MLSPVFLPGEPQGQYEKGQLSIYMKMMQSQISIPIITTATTTKDSKRITDLNAGAKTMSLLEENIWLNLHDFGLGKVFLDTTSKEHVTKEKR